MRVSLAEFLNDLGDGDGRGDGARVPVYFDGPRRVVRGERIEKVEEPLSVVLERREEHVAFGPHF